MANNQSPTKLGIMQKSINNNYPSANLFTTFKIVKNNLCTKCFWKINSTNKTENLNFLLVG